MQAITGEIKTLINDVRTDEGWKRKSWALMRVKAFKMTAIMTIIALILMLNATVWVSYGIGAIVVYRAQQLISPATQPQGIPIPPPPPTPPAQQPAPAPTTPPAPAYPAPAPVDPPQQPQEPSPEMLEKFRRF